MNRTTHYLLIVLTMGCMTSWADEGEETKAPVVYGTQDVGKVASDLQRLEKYVYRAIGPNQLNQAKPAEIPEDAKGASQAQIDLLMKKHEEVAGAIPTLTSRLEEAEHTVQKLLENNKTFIQYLTHYKKLMAEADAKRQDLEAKVAQLQAGKPSPVSEVPAPEKELSPGEIPSLPPLEMPPSPEAPAVVAEEPLAQEEVELTIEELEKKARTSLLTAQYDVAQKTFESMLERQLSDEQAASSHFYLGEIAQLKKDHATASGHYLKSFQKAPNTAKAPKSLLKLAMTLHNLDKKKEACASLGKLLTDYPKADAATLTMANAKKKEYKCAP